MKEKVGDGGGIVWGRGEGGGEGREGKVFPVAISLMPVWDVNSLINRATSGKQKICAGREWQQKEGRHELEIQTGYSSHPCISLTGVQLKRQQAMNNSVCVEVNFGRAVHYSA